MLDRGTLKWAIHYLDKDYWRICKVYSKWIIFQLNRLLLHSSDMITFEYCELEKLEELAQYLFNCSSYSYTAFAYTMPWDANMVSDKSHHATSVTWRSLARNDKYIYYSNHWYICLGWCFHVNNVVFAKSSTTNHARMQEVYGVFLATCYSQNWYDRNQFHAKVDSICHSYIIRIIIFRL